MTCRLRAADRPETAGVFECRELLVVDRGAVVGGLGALAGAKCAGVLRGHDVRSFLECDDHGVQVQVVADLGGESLP
jgi:hypothetical protein